MFKFFINFKIMANHCYHFIDHLKNHPYHFWNHLLNSRRKSYKYQMDKNNLNGEKYVMKIMAVQSYLYCTEKWWNKIQSIWWLFSTFLCDSDFRNIVLYFLLKCINIIITYQNLWHIKGILTDLKHWITIGLNFPRNLNKLLFIP